MIKLTKFQFILGALAAIFVATANGGVAVADDDDGGVKSKTVPFFLKLNVGDTVTIARNGDLEVFAECTRSGNRIQMRLIATSPNEYAGPSNSGSLNAGGSLRGLSIFSIPDNTVAFGSARFSLGSAVQDDSHYIRLDEGTSSGVNVFGYDCVTAGTAVLISERTDDDDD